MSIPRAEHPEPQFARAAWKNLNGLWQFEVDNGQSGVERGLAEVGHKLSMEIMVPFCPESDLSGVGIKDFMYGVWYKRAVDLTEEECAERVVLHFGAVDYACDVYVNGKKAGGHKGGYVSFQIDITDFVQPGKNEIAVFARDNTRDMMIPSGKQSSVYNSEGCFYTRTTGIWQTVWLEFTPKTYIERVEYTPDTEKSTLILRAFVKGTAALRAEAFYEGRSMGCAEAASAGGEILLLLPLRETHLWELGHGRLYDLQLTYGEDHVQSYFGLRSLRLDETRFYLNDKPTFQRLVLDQGFYPDGIYTAPSDAALEQDIDLSMAMGFNGARLHEKVFEARFLYHCDRKGYMVWGEYPNWGLDHTDPVSVYPILPEWLEVVQRDRNHPSIIGWCPFNETWARKDRRQYDDLLRLVYHVTKAVDPSRPCIDTSGWYHVETDIFDVHDYEQNPAVFKEKYDRLPQEGFLCDNAPVRGQQTYTGGPAFVSEYGGIQWSTDSKSWGYGMAPASLEEFRSRLKGLTDAMLDNPRMLGFCYTQLTDVEQEQNGLYTADRQPKLDPAWVSSVLKRKAAVE